MTLIASVLVGEERETAVDFPEPGFDLEPGTLGRAARYLLDEDHTVNMEYVFPHIGFDAREARRHLAALAEEKRKAGEGPEDEHRQAVKKFRITAKAIGLELVAGLILSVLDSPRKTRCPCRALIVEGSAVPYYWARQGNPDVRADYRNFAILAEVTTIRKFTMEDVERQWKSACRHAVAVADRPRVYCLMVSRLSLDLRDKKKQVAQHRKHLANLANAQGLLAAAAAEAAQKAQQAQARAEDDGEPEPPPAGLPSRTGGGSQAQPDVKFILLHIEDMSAIAHGLHDLYCGTNKSARRLTENILGAVLDGLHAKTMERIAARNTFPRRWASDTFIDLLKGRVEPSRRGKTTTKKKKKPTANRKAG